MKILHLVFQNLINLYKSNKLLLFIVLLGISVSFTSFSLITGTVSYLINTSQGGNVAGTFSIKIDKDINDINGIVNNLLETDKDITHILLISIADDNPMLVGMKGDYEKWYFMDAGRSFDDNEIKNAEQVAVISSDLYQKDDFDFQSSKYKINDAQFSIIGLSELPSNELLFLDNDDLYKELYGNTSEGSTQTVDLHDENDEHDQHDEHDEEEHLDDEIDMERQTIIMPYTTYLEAGFKPNVIRIQYFIKSNKHREEIIRSLKERFPDQKMYLPDKPISIYSDDVIKNLFLSVSIFLISIINIIALFAYWLGINKRQYNIYHMLGAKGKKNRAIIFIEWFSIVVLAYLLSLIIRILIRPFTEFVKSDIDFKLSKDLLIFSVTYIMSLLFLLPNIKRISKINISILKGGK